MPFVWDNEVARDVRVGENQITRIYSGYDLIWGIFKFIYINFFGNTPEQFVWGIGKKKFQTVKCWDGNRDTLYNEVGGYKDSLNVTGDCAWYENQDCTKRFNLSTGVPRTTKNDVKVYAKWKVTSSIYRMVYSHTYWVDGSSAGGGDTSGSGDYPTFGNNLGGSPGSPPGFDGVKYGSGYSKYYWDSSRNPFAVAGNYIPNCTTYAAGRALQAGWGCPVNGTPNAANWINNPSSGWTAYKASDGHTASEMKAGDIGVCSGHVFFLESNGKASASGWTSDSGHRSSPTDASEYWPTHDSYHWYHNDRSVSDEISWGHGGFLGYLRYTGGVNNDIIVNASYADEAGITCLDWYKSHSSDYLSPEQISPYFGQCTWYAQGRTNAIFGDGGAPWSNYGFPSAGSSWISSAKGNWKGTYSSSDVHRGAIVVWSGHVLVVERVNADGTFYCSHWNADGSTLYPSGVHNSNAPITLSPNDSRIIGYVVRKNSSSGGGGSSSGNFNTEAGEVNGYMVTEYYESDKWLFSENFDDWPDPDGEWKKDHLEEKTVYKIIKGYEVSDWIG